MPVLGIPGVLVLASQTFSSLLGQPRPRPRARLQRPLMDIHDLEVSLMLALDVALARVHDLEIALALEVFLALDLASLSLF